MAQKQPKKIKRFATKKTGAATKNSKKRLAVKGGAPKQPQTPVPPPVTPQSAPPVQPQVPQPAPTVQQQATQAAPQVAVEQPVAAVQPSYTPPQPQPQVPQPQPQAPQPQPQVVQQSQPQQVHPAPPPMQQPQQSVAPAPVPPMPVMQPSTPPMPPPAQQPMRGVMMPPQQGMSEGVNMPTQAGVFQGVPVGERTGAFDKRSNNKKVLRGKPAPQTDSEDLKDEVASYLEVCDSCLSNKTEPRDLVDVVHMLVRSLNFDVLTIALLDENKEDLVAKIASRGYEAPPTKAVIECWNRAVIKGDGISWERLMKVAQDTNTELAYWIVYEGLDAIGYVPIRDSNTIYGFLFVARKESKRQSPLAAHLLDACGSRIGLVTALKYNKGDWPQSIFDLSTGIRNQFSLAMGYMEMLKEGQSMSPEDYNAILEYCNRSIMESTQMLDSMTSEAGLN